MTTRGKIWAVVLAAGDGTRLSSLTTDAFGNAVPKQYCSLDGEGSLLEAAVARAHAIVPRSRTCVIVAAQHRRWWKSALWALPPSNLIVQPRNCGTAIGILLAVLDVLARDPLARIVFLPADHHVANEDALVDGLHATAALLDRHAGDLLLLGIEPDEADPELGYIVPAEASSSGASPVARFAEKPSAGLASELVGRGALWNSFIFGAHGAVLMDLLRQRLPAVVDAMIAALAQDARESPEGTALADLYEILNSVDFSRSILQGAEARLKVVRAPACGWTDLGTPRRVGETLQRRPMVVHGESHRRRVRVPGFINLAVQHARLPVPS
jgi:mannose-1-phosphate guanylyltransferase